MTTRSSRKGRFLLSLGGLLALSCFDETDRWLTAVSTPVVDECTLGERRCAGNLEECTTQAGTAKWVATEYCASANLVCSPTLLECVSCLPGKRGCDGHTVVSCSEDGTEHTAVAECDTGVGQACRDGQCQDLCALARQTQSNVGCEYWAVDLDNAMIDETLNAAAQQFAVVVSNPHPDLPARVSVEQDDSAVGADNDPVQMLEVVVPPLGLEVLPLGPREVDGSAPGTYNTGTHTALTRAAYRLRSSVPVVAVQFNPLENVDVFSNDASLLKPVEALGGSADVRVSYVALGWPQTIASTDDPDTNFSASMPADLRAFLTIVGTSPDTTVRVRPTVDFLGAPGVAATAAGGMLEVTLQPFDVLNLETDGFNADVTGTIVESDRPVAVFSGGEASDAPTFEIKADRRCCADHLEEQLDPVRTAGTEFVATVSSNRSAAVRRAGAEIGVVPQPEAFRVVATTNAGARITTSLKNEFAKFLLREQGDFAEITTESDFLLSSDQPVMLGHVTPSQSAAGVPTGLPGGDPSFVIVPPVEQFRSTYVFLTPDRYAFDFLRVIAPVGASVFLDGVSLDTLSACTGESEVATQSVLSAASTWQVRRCQLSFPTIDPRAPAGQGLEPGEQDDGVHVLISNRDVGVLVDGFDRNVSYGYAAGTDLEEITPQ